MSRVFSKACQIMTASLIAMIPKIDAAVFHDIDSTSSLSVEFSSKSQNRVSVEGGSIRKVICPEGWIAIQMEPECGQAFVFSTRENSEPTTLSVVTAQGFVQDLEVTFKDQPSQVVVLKEPAIEISRETEDLSKTDHLVEIIKSLRSGIIPKGFVVRKKYESRSQKVGGELKTSMVKELKPGVSARRQYLIQGPLEYIFKYELVNQTESSVVVHEDLLAGANDLWVYLERSLIGPGEKTIAFVGGNR